MYAAIAWLHLVVLFVAGCASLAFLGLYWKMYRHTWLREDHVWLYIVAMNATVATVAATSVGLYFVPDAISLAWLRLLALTGFAASVIYQIVLLHRP